MKGLLEKNSILMTIPEQARKGKLYIIRFSEGKLFKEEGRSKVRGPEVGTCLATSGEAVRLEKRKGAKSRMIKIREEGVA